MLGAICRLAQSADCARNLQTAPERSHSADCEPRQPSLQTPSDCVVPVCRLGSVVSLQFATSQSAD